MGTKRRKRSESQYAGPHSGAIRCARCGSFPQQSLLSRHKSFAQSHLTSQFLQITAQPQSCVCFCCLLCCQICCVFPPPTNSLFLPRVLLIATIIVIYRCKVNLSLLFEFLPNDMPNIDKRWFQPQLQKSQHKQPVSILCKQLSLHYKRTKKWRLFLQAMQGEYISK